MRFSHSALFVTLFLGATIAQETPTMCTVDTAITPPWVAPRWMRNGQVIPIENSSTMTTTTTIAVVNVTGCCALEMQNEEISVLSPTQIGQMPQMKEEEVLKVLEYAKEAWKGGSGVWPQMSLGERVKAIRVFVNILQDKREQIINVLMWEIGKNINDATAEFDRTMLFIDKLIETIQSDPEFNTDWQSIGDIRAFVRRAAIGIIMCLGPYNYPLNETYATLIPALLMGNIVVMKIPTVGGLSHLLTMEAFSKALPKGTIHFVSGSGRSTMPPLMASGSIDGLAFIGGSRAADELIRQHPSPHRLKLFLQLEAKNMGIFLPDLFQERSNALLETALNEAVSGTSSYNGQRCTALKLLFVPTANANVFVKKFVEKINTLRIGLPWHTNGGISHITPLPNQQRIIYMKELIDDAVSKGATVVNKNGGTIIGGPNSTLMVPAVLYPVTASMKIYHEEQFGPVIPIVPYDTLETVLLYGREGIYGQQVSIFTSEHDAPTAASLLDHFSTVFGKININSQCGRSPDNLVFSGRRSSAMGVMSIKYALQEFSVPTAVVYKEMNRDIVNEIQKSSKFLEAL
jgi:glyceraldehyde-3-phosphate dehydrogenase (NADP+)